MEKPFKLTVVLDRITQAVALNAKWRKIEQETPEDRRTDGPVDSA